MFQDNQFLGISLALIFMVACVATVILFTRKLIAQERILFLAIFLITLLASVWAIDNVIAFKTLLLDDEENKAILQMMNNVVALILGYYIGSKKQNEI